MSPPLLTRAKRKQIINGGQSACLVGLSEREIAVLRLVAKGLTDAQVAKRLVLSPHPVSTHLRSIYNKLHIDSRSAMMRLAIEYHLA